MNYISSVGSLISVIGLLFFFSVILDLIIQFGFFAESSSSFVISSYSNLIKLGLPFSSSLKKAVYIFPKYRFFNVFNTHSLFLKTYTVFYSIFLQEFKIVFKYLRTFNHFWFYCFVFNIFPKSFVKKFVIYHFKYVLFSKIFYNNSSRNFFYFCKSIALDIIYL